MSKAPPLLPAETLFRMVRLARRDGIVVLGLSGSLAIASAALGDYGGALVGVVIAGAGVFELHGATLLTAGKAQGVNWLVGSQLYLLVAVLGYVFWRLQAYDPEWVKQFTAPMLHTAEMQAKLEEAGATDADMLRMMRLIYHVTYAVVAILTVFYQGGMALYYHRRRAAVTAALGEQGEGHL
jgi:hypothetical protein